MSEPMKLLTAEQVAAKLQVHVNTVYKNREIPRLEISEGVVRWCESDIDAWLRSKITRKAKPDKRIAKTVDKDRLSNFMRRSSGGSDAA